MQTETDETPKHKPEEEHAKAIYEKIAKVAPTEQDIQWLQQNSFADGAAVPSSPVLGVSPSPHAEVSVVSLLSSSSTAVQQILPFISQPLVGAPGSVVIPTSTQLVAEAANLTIGRFAAACMSENETLVVEFSKANAFEKSTNAHMLRLLAQQEAQHQAPIQVQQAYRNTQMEMIEFMTTLTAQGGATGSAGSATVPQNRFEDDFGGVLGAGGMGTEGVQRRTKVKEETGTSHAGDFEKEAKKFTKRIEQHVKANERHGKCVSNHNPDGEKQEGGNADCA